MSPRARAFVNKPQRAADVDEDCLASPRTDGQNPPKPLFSDDLKSLRQEWLADMRLLLEESNERLVQRLLDDGGALRNTRERTATGGDLLVSADSLASQELMLLNLSTDPNIGTTAIIQKHPERPAAQNVDDYDHSPSKFSATVQGAFQFAGADRSALDEETYCVTQFYKDRGVAQMIARSKWFENVTLAVISLNAVYLGIDVDRNGEALLENADIGFQLSEHSFCVFFSLELLIRFASFRKSYDCLKDSWFKFDTLLVLLMVAETWCVPLAFYAFGSDSRLLLGNGNGPAVDPAPLRLLRLLRLSRLVRLMKALPELVTMFKGMYVAARAVASSCLLVMMMIYVFAIVLFMLLRDVEAVSFQFKTLPVTMWTLFIDGTLLDGCGELLRTLLDLGTPNATLSVLVFFMFMLLSAVTVMNMLIGVLCEVVSTVSQNEKDEAAIKLLKKTILLELRKFDDNNDGVIGKDELEQVMENPEALSVLRSLEVDIACLKELQQMLFPTQNVMVPISMVINHLLDYRSSLPTTVRHAVDGQAYTLHVVSHQNRELQKHLVDLGAQLRDIERRIAT